MSAADWYRIRIERESGTGAYVFGSPAEVRPPALWGRTVVTSATMPAGQALVLDTTFITLLDRMAPTVMVSTQHASNFTANLATVLCELRAGLQVGETGAVLRVELSSAASSSSSN
jgi:HK97 family phage major capsid protein